jgi:Tyrosine phosphatase family
MQKRISWLIACCICLALMIQSHVALAVDSTTRLATARNPAVGEKVPSEDSIVPDFHSLGLINGQLNIFRSACPVRDIAKKMSSTRPSDDQLKEAQARMQHLYDLGIRTIISFQNPSPNSNDAGDRETAAGIDLERGAAEDVGIHFLLRPMSNSGPNSLQTMTDQQVLQWVDAMSVEIFADAKTGGVLFHCSAGHDRTGIVAAYLRIKYEHWNVEQAIDEMRRYGHNWLKFSADGGVSSWHEQHLRAIAALLNTQLPTTQSN